VTLTEICLVTVVKRDKDIAKLRKAGQWFRFFGALFFFGGFEIFCRQPADPAKYATTFGFAGAYFDYVCEIAEKRGGLRGLINLDITENEIKSILNGAGFKGYRLAGATEWIKKTLQIIRELA